MARTTVKRTPTTQKATKTRARKAAKRPARRQTAKVTTAARTKNAARAAAGRTTDQPLAGKSAVSMVGNIARGVAGIAVAAITSRLPWAKNENDPIVLLKSDHRRFEKLLADGEATTARAKKGRLDILTALASELTVHEAIEEKILYPVLRSYAAAHDLVLESYQEHHVADVLIKELRKLDRDDEKWGAKFKVLKESIAHHISEEENKMFPVARGVLGRQELLDIGARMRALKAELEG